MNLKSIIETILFVRADPVDVATLATITNHTKEEVRAAILQLKDDYRDRGFVVLEKDDTWQLASNPANSAYAEDLIKSEYNQELSRSALETLAIICYKGPISRFDIDYLRGVNSSFTVRNLLMRGLIERVENPKDSRSHCYRATFDFLKHFGLTSMDQLPRFEEFNKQKIEIMGEKSDDKPSFSE